ncbi:MAG: hypothetical protein JO257_04705 [Deltaproteobacteria bacterium]|nr:hypothetical protein [Deltaproteobacteria bacterium]
MRTLVLVVVAGAVACGGDKPRHTPDASPVDAAPPDAPACPPVTGAGTMHTGTITTAQTWSAADSPHIIPSDTSLRADITIEACAVVQIGDGKTLDVRGVLTAAGMPGKPVTIEAIDPQKPWSRILAELGGTLRFSYTNVRDGGAPLNAPLDVAAAIDVRGPDQTQPPGETFDAQHVVIEGSRSQGVSVREAGGFSATSTDLVIHGSANVPIRTWASAAGSIPAGTYTGNAVDEIVLEGSGLASIVRDQTFHARGVPYRVGDSIAASRLDVAATTGVAALTIEPGVTIKLKSGGIINVQVAQNTAPATGALIAVGTAAAPIVFTSAQATPAAGDWLAIHFNGLPDPRSRLDFVRVEYAGGVSANQGSSCRYPDNMNNAAAIRIFTEPASAFVTNTTVVASAAYGIDRGWLGSTAISFVAANDLSGAAKCKETYPTPTGGTCPTPVPCP